MAFLNEYSECLVIHESGTVKSVVSLHWEIPYIYVSVL
jgi:hypothetical protein